MICLDFSSNSVIITFVKGGGYVSKKQNVDVLNGNLIKSIISFGIPLLFVSLIQNLFNAVDIMVLGQMATTSAVAAVGATGSIVHLLTNLALGISVGTKIVISRLLGENVKEKTEQAVFTSIVTAIGVGLFTAIAGIAISPAFLRLTNCPPEIFSDALLYLRLYFASAPAIMLYNFGSSVIQASGDSKRPLYYMIVSGLLNVVLNFILCLIFPQKVAAVAIATAISQAIGAILVLRRISTMENDCRLNYKVKNWSTPIFKKLLSNGLPIGFTSSLYSLANLQIQSSLNLFGANAIAGSAAGSNIESIEASIASSPWAATVSVFVGQNVGADNKKRVKHSILMCATIAISLAIFLSTLIYTFNSSLLSLFVDSSEAVKYGMIRAQYLLLPYAIACANSILSNSLQAFGYSLLTTVNSTVNVLIFRFIWMTWIYPLCPTFAVLMQCFLVSWILVISFNLIFFVYVYHRKFKAGKLKKMG